MMDQFEVSRFESIGNTVRKKRTQTSRRPKPESQVFPQSRDRSPLSSTPSDDASKVSSDENADIDGNPRRKFFNLNQCASWGFSTAGDGESPPKRVKKECGSNMLHDSSSLADGTEQGRSEPNHKQISVSGVIGSESKFKKVKLKVGGVTRTIQTNSSSSRSVQFSDAPKPRPKLILQDNSDEDHCAPNKKSGLQGIPWKDFSTGGFQLGREDSRMGRSGSRKQAEKSEGVRKSKRVPKKRVLDGASDEEEDDEIRYLEKLKTSKIAAAYCDFEEEPRKKQNGISRVSKTDYEVEESASEDELEGKKKKPRKDSPASPAENRRETTLTSRQRALLAGRDASSGASQIEFPNGLPPAPPRKQKEKLSEVEQQLKKAEAAEKRRIQNEKAARESEAEAIRKILGQDSSRKKREDKLKKRQEELAQEKAANAQTLAPGTVRCVMGPTGTVITFAEDVGLPHIFDPKPASYPAPREKCAGPSCTNPYRYRDSKSNLPLCSLQCYKVVNEERQSEATC